MIPEDDYADPQEETDLNFAVIINSMVEGLVYDEEVKIHRLLENVFIIETTTDNNEMFSIGLSVIQGWNEDQVLTMAPVQKINPFKYAATVLVGNE